MGSSFGLGLGLHFAVAMAIATPAYEDITATLTASRTSGVAPLAVHFDSLGTTGVLATEPFSDLRYVWDFDDPTPTFSGGNSGPVVSHVFDQPGTYRVVLTVLDSSFQYVTKAVTITVTDPDTVFSGTNTVCVSTSGTFTGAPSGSTQVTSSDFDSVVGTYFGSGKRLLFRVGETFTSSATVTLTNTSAAILGAFGTETSPDSRGIASNAPIISVMHNNVVVSLGSNPTTCTDLRCIGLKFSYDNGGTRYHLFDLGFRADQLLVYRCTDVATKSFDQVFSVGHETPVGFGADVCHDLCVANCYWNAGTGNDYGFYGAARGLSLLNTYWGPQRAASSGHVVRVQFGRNIHIAGCEFDNAASSKHCLTIRARDYVTDADETRYFVVEGNTFYGSTVWITHFGSESTGHREHVDDGLIVGNHFQFEAGSNNGYAVHSGGRRIVAYNNTMDANSGASITSIRMFFSDNYGSAGQPDPSIRVFNNTVYSSITLSGNLRLINAAAGTAEVKNNLLWGASVGSYTVTAGAATFTASNNLSATDPLFVSSSDLHLTASSPAIGYGTATAFCLVDRDAVQRTPAVDAGAYQYV